MNSIFLGDWQEGGFFNMVMNFAGLHISKLDYLSDVSPYPNESHWNEQKSKAKASLDDPQHDVEVILAYYVYEDYSGTAFVLFRRDGNLYEVNASHCSCYGLEGQWSPEETTVEAMRKRMKDGRLGRDYDGTNEFADELSAQLDAFEKEFARTT